MLKKPVLALVLVFALIVAACGASEGSSGATVGQTTEGDGSSPTSTALADEDTELDPDDSRSADEDPGDPSSALADPVLNEMRLAVQVGDAFYGSDGVTADTQFRIGSAAKMFTALVVAQLAAEGELSFDDPLSKYIDTKATATVGEVLTHRGGIIDDESGVDFNEAYANQTEVVSPSIMTDLATFTESDSMAYSNTGYLFAGDVIAAVTGEHPAVAVRERIIEPLALDNTCWPSVDDDCEVDVPGIVNTSLVGGDGSNEFVQSYTSVDALSGSAGALISSADDLARFLKALVGEELPGAAEMIASTANPEFELEKTSGLYGFLTTYGYGLMVDRSGKVGHAGQTFGFSSWAAIDPGTGKISVALVNDSSMTATLLPVAVEEFGGLPPLDVLLELRENS